MKVFFDARYTRYPRHDGVSRYGAELLRELMKIRDDITVIICDERQLANLPEGIAHTVKLNKPTSPLEPFIAGQLNRLGADVVFSPLQTMGSLGKKYKLILTVHDLIYYTHRTPPRQFSPLLRLGWRAFHVSYAPERLLLSGADAVAVVSNTTKKDVLRHHLTKRPIAVIPNAAPAIREITPRKPTKSLAYMGSFVPYKNVDTLVRAMSLLPGYTLELLSKVDAAEQQRLTDLCDDPTQLHFANGVSDEAYHEALAECTASVTASRFEGFGIPLLEAQQAGAPVICSDIPIFHEVATDSALFYDPESPEALAQCVRELEKPKVRAGLVKKGRVNAIRYSWPVSARLLSDLIDSL
jgi:glycosyltransferase involved in cell wall biosynthesis